jgi:hypothetical protein
MAVERRPLHPIISPENQDQIEKWQAGVESLLATRMDTYTGRRLLLPFGIATSTALVAACGPTKRDISLVADPAPTPATEANFSIENEASQPPETIVTRLIEATFRPRYRGIFTSNKGTQIIKQDFQRIGTTPNFVHTPQAVAEYNYYVTYPTYLGHIKEDDFYKSSQGKTIVTHTTYNITFDTNNTWSHFVIFGKSNLDNIPEVRKFIHKTSKPNGEIVYGMPPDKLMQAGDLLIVLPQDAQKTYIPKKDTYTSDHWSVQGVFQTNTTPIAVKFSLSKERGAWSLELTRPNYVKRPQ